MKWSLFAACAACSAAATARPPVAPVEPLPTPAPDRVGQFSGKRVGHWRTYSIGNDILELQHEGDYVDDQQDGAWNYTSAGFGPARVEHWKHGKQVD